MKDLPQGLDQTDLINALAEGWGLEVTNAAYRPVGAGSYHWVVTDAHRKRHFVTVDDLDDKGYLGANRDLAFDGLRRAFGATLALRLEGGLDFVVAPQPTPTGEAVRRIDSQFTIAVFSLIDGTSRGYGETAPPEERAELVRMLVELHAATPVTLSVARPARLQVPGRDRLESALHYPDDEWTGGPFSEPARALLVAHREDVLHLLESFDHLADRVAASSSALVITHGEPHSGNVVRTGGRLVLVDWDTAGLAPPERDLWMVEAGAGDELKLYADASGRRVDKDAIALYGLRWQLDDIATYLDQLRSPHSQTADTEHAWRSLSRVLSTA